MLTVGSDTFSVDHVTVQDTQDTALVTISNYSRASYAGIPWNTFRGKLSFYTDTYMTVEGKKVTGPLVKNTLSFSDYMK
ncbi:hypothetical protein J5893_03840 [bacterium]|nr:hypothetical protein [bacterium]